MCGRYAATRSTDELVEELQIEADHTREVPRGLLKTPQQPPPGEPDYNVAPTKQARVVLTRAPKDESRTGPGESGVGGPGESRVGGSAGGSVRERGTGTASGPAPVRQLRLLTWGLVPSWSKDAAGAVRMINARAESLFDKAAYRRAAASRRCLVPASGWYEWQASPVATDAKGKPLKQPFYVTRADGASIALAGLYEFWRDPGAGADDPGAWLTTFAIITHAAEPGLDRIHDRQPFVLDRDRWADWLDPGRTDRGDVERLVTPYPPGRFEAYPVGRAIGSGRANGPEVLRPLGRDELRGVVDPTTGEVING